MAFLSKTHNQQSVPGKTSKKKNTYVLKLGGSFADLTLFSACNDTPMRVITINGVPQQKSNGWMASTRFPNPGATTMAAEFKTVSPVMGEKMASTIVEYLDKYTGRPVILLFPTVAHIMDGYTEKNYLQHLNHASRRDLEFQINKRAKLIDQILAGQRQK